MTKHQFFYCYSKKVSDYLTSKGINYIMVAIEPKSGKLFSQYYIDEPFQKAMNEYRSNK